MHKKILRGVAALTLVAGFAVVPGAAAQGRPGPERGRQIQTDQVPWWVPGVGVSIRAEVRDASPAELAAEGLTQAGGAVVTQVDEGGPAATAGLKAGDVVVEFDGERVRSARHLVRLVHEASEGRPVKVTVSAQKTTRTLDVTPVDSVSAMLNTPEVRRQVERGARELGEEFRRRFDDPEGPFGAPLGPRRQLGVELLPLSDQLASYFGVPSGALVARVQEGSAASQAGVKAGDVIVKVNDSGVADAGEVVRQVRRSGTQLTLSVIREKKELTLKATLPDPEQRRVRPQTKPA